MFVLVLLILAGSEVIAQDLGEYENMDTCFESRDVLVERLGRPIINYQAVCVKKVENEA